MVTGSVCGLVMGLWAWSRAAWPSTSACGNRHLAGGEGERGETANQSKCENKDLMLLMSTQKDETAVRHYIFNRMCLTPYQDYFCETKQNCKHFYGFLESVNFIG